MTDFEGHHFVCNKKLRPIANLRTESCETNESPDTILQRNTSTCKVLQILLTTKNLVPISLWLWSLNVCLEGGLHELHHQLLTNEEVKVSLTQAVKRVMDICRTTTPSNVGSLRNTQWGLKAAFTTIGALLHRLPRCNDVVTLFLKTRIARKKNLASWLDTMQALDSYIT